MNERLLASREEGYQGSGMHSCASRVSFQVFRMLTRLSSTARPLLTCAALAVTALPAAPTSTGVLRDSREIHLADVRQLTMGGENAEAYWSADGRQLVFQSSRPPFSCDQIFRVTADDLAPSPVLVSTGKGRTTCAFFEKGDGRVLYSSTHLAGDACPPPPDRSQGYVWPIDPRFEIFTARADGSDVRPLTRVEGYDAEATVCPRDGSIVFTSTRDGDLDLYRMDADGSNVKRLTDTPGYDGGAFFSPDCSKLVWRASRPKPGPGLEEYRRLLENGLVRPTKLELFVANADGSEPRQITYLFAASFAPSFFPSGQRIVFSSNHGDPKGREFDLWAVNLDGTALERITFTSGFDGFPMFSPDGKRLAFASNRNQGKPGETDIYVARWADAPSKVEVSAADRILADVRWLADDAREGRGIGTRGLEESAGWLAARYRGLELIPAGDGGTFAQSFPVPVLVRVKEKRLSLDGVAVPESDYVPAGFSSSGEASGEVVAAGYGITAPEFERDDYGDLDTRGKIVVVRRFTPEGGAFSDTKAQRRYGDLRYKAWNARQHGARALLVVDWPEVPSGKEPPAEAPLPAPAVDSQGDAGILALVVKRGAGGPLFATSRRASLRVALQGESKPAANVVGRIPAGAPDRLPGAVVIGAHYDHLGLGGRASLAPGVSAPHGGADDNASGTAALLEVARILASHRSELRRDVYIAAFSGEESGVIGSTWFTRRPPNGVSLPTIAAMLNMDMVGRLRSNRLTVLGTESAAEWGELVAAACERERIECSMSGDGYGPSDHSPFYAGGVPVLHFFSGPHGDYHKPSDRPEQVNAAGVAQIAELAADLARAVAARETRLNYKAVPAPPPAGDVRSYGASLGTIPDYVGSPDGKPGVLLGAVRAGGPAELAGLRRGDLLVRLGDYEIRNIEDFEFALRRFQPGDKTTAVVERAGEKISFPVTLAERRR